jgi:hypothetical protein
VHHGWASMPREGIMQVVSFWKQYKTILVRKVATLRIYICKAYVQFQGLCLLTHASTEI